MKTYQLISRLGLAACLLSFSATVFAQCPRIISQSPYITHQLDYLGVKHCIVGASRYNKELAVTDTGGLLDPDRQAIQSLKPDLWLTSDWTPQAQFDAIETHIAKAIRLESFGSMQQIEHNLLDIAQHLNNPVALKKVQDFAQHWRQTAKSIDGKGQKLLLVSSCSGLPYSFGLDSWLADLFNYAGFQVVGHQQRITHLPITADENQLQALINQLQPDLVFIFERKLTPVCQIMSLPQNTRIITLDGTDFLQPAPIMLKGLNELKLELNN